MDFVDVNLRFLIFQPVPSLPCIIVIDKHSRVGMPGRTNLPLKFQDTVLLGTIIRKDPIGSTIDSLGSPTSYELPVYSSREQVGGHGQLYGEPASTGQKDNGMEHIVEIKSVEWVNHNVLGIRTEKPDGYDYRPGQATELSINQGEWRGEKRPFTFTNLPSSQDLEFTIKVYPEHKGVTEMLSRKEIGEELIVREVFGAITYKGKGTFLAGGAGATPFIAILRALEDQGQIEGNSLIFANRKMKDIFLKEEFERMLGNAFYNVLSEERTAAHAYGTIDRDFLRSMNLDFSQYFYVCGPPDMVDQVVLDLKGLGVKADRIVQEVS